MQVIEALDLQIFKTKIQLSSANMLRRGACEVTSNLPFQLPCCRGPGPSWEWRYIACQKASPQLPDPGLFVFIPTEGIFSCPAEYRVVLEINSWTLRVDFYLGLPIRESDSSAHSSSLWTVFEAKEYLFQRHAWDAGWTSRCFWMKTLFHASKHI